MAAIPLRIAFIGFGEAGAAFAPAMPGKVTAYDRKTDHPATREEKLGDYRRAGVESAATSHDAVAGAALILSLVTADQALAAAEAAASDIATGALYADLNSVAPDTKRAAALAIERAGGRYVDGAVMAPVHPQRRAVPLLLSGPHASPATEALANAGFSDVRVVGSAVGQASAIKMIRSVMVKGIEALTAECVLAARGADVLDEVLASLDGSWPGADWRRRADYNLDRMMVHGVRRADEMAEVVRTLEALGTGAAMARATAERQRAVGRLRLAPAATLDGKLAMLLGGDVEQAA